MRAEMLPDTWIFTLDSSDEFLALEAGLEGVSTDHPGQLEYGLSLHHKNQTFRSTAPHDEATARAIIRS